MRKVIRWLMLAWALSFTLPWAAANPIQVHLGGLDAVGPQAVLALDFIDGDGPSNQVTVNGFASDGALALQSLAGAVSGSVAGGLQFDDTGFFNEALLLSSGASTLAFGFSATGVAPLAGGFMDSFSVFLLDPVSGLSLVLTDDPTGANALFQFSIDGSGAGLLQVFQQVSQLDVSWSATSGGGGGNVPEPSSWLLAIMALAVCLGLWGRRAGVRLLAHPLARVSALALAMGLSGQAAQAEDLTAAVQISRGGLVLNRTSNTFDAQVTVTNRSADTLVGPLSLALDGAVPANVALYNSDGRLPSGADYVTVPLVNGTLEPGASTVATVRLLNYGQPVTSTAFSVHGTRLNASNRALVDVTGIYPAGLMGPQEVSVGAGFTVKVDGVVRGTTNVAGKLLVAVPVGASVVSLSRSPSEGGSMTLPTLAVGATASVTVSVDDGKEIAADSKGRFDQVQQGVLSRASTRISLRFLKDEQPVRLTTLSGVSVVDILGNYFDLTGLFSVQADGSLAAAPTAFFQQMAGKSGKLRLEFSGEDAAGGVHVASTTFHLADYRVRIQLVAPPSNPSLPLAGIRVTASVLNSELRFIAQSDAAGIVTIPDVPSGNLSLNGSVTVGGIVYNGVGTAAINRNTLISLTMRGPQDVINNVTPIVAGPLAATAQVQPLSGAQATVAPATLSERPYFTAAEAAARQSLHDQRAKTAPAAPRIVQVAPLAGNAVTVSATGGAQNVLAQNSAQLVVKKGSKKVVLKYTVFTAEYPTFVLQQSIYNDVWSVSVLGGNGAQLFEITRQINSQLFQAPVWQANGSTGEIKQEIDVTALAAAADVTLIVRATSVNIGDGLLATTASATLDASEPLLIGEITPSPMPAGTNNDGSFYSIPLPGATNTLARTFTVELTKPSGSTLTTVQVDLRSGAGAALMTVLQPTAPGAADVTIANQTDTTARLEVRATISNPASTVAGAPPPTRDLTYHFIVKAKDADGNELTDEKDVSGKRALWRMPAGFGRYGTRDNGGDDWTARGAYNWLVANQARVREIDDISGEHGRNVGHASHARGTDIDMYHFYRFPGAVSGGQNYTLLQADVVLAFQTLQPTPPAAATAALGRVAAWLAATRQGLTDLAALPTVSQLIYCSGIAAQGLPAGWCSTLLRTGTVTRTVATATGPQVQSLALGGTFNHAKMMYRNDHNNHIHVTLNAGQIGE